MTHTIEKRTKWSLQQYALRFLHRMSRSHFFITLLNFLTFLKIALLHKKIVKHEVRIQDLPGLAFSGIGNSRQSREFSGTSLIYCTYWTFHCNLTWPSSTRYVPGWPRKNTKCVHQAATCFCLFWHKRRIPKLCFLPGSWEIVYLLFWILITVRAPI